jgi:uncharacterized membrane protein YeaQ/YmgE (transglycosylase-associated protein family)
MNEKAGIIIYGMTLLTALAIAYWMITKQDGTVLTTISGVIGGAVGYLVKSYSDSDKNNNSDKK